MARLLVNRSAVARSLGRALGQLGLCLIALNGVVLAVLLSSGVEPEWLFVLFSFVSIVYFGAGLLAWWRRPSNRVGSLIVIGGVFFTFAEMGNLPVRALSGVGVVLSTVILAVVVHLLHAFPSGRLRGRLSRWTVGTGYFVAIVLQAPLYLWDPSAAALAPLSLGDHPGLLLAGKITQDAVGLAVVVVTAFILAIRLRRANGKQRRVLVPLFGYGIFSLLFIPLHDVVINAFGVSEIAVIGAQLVVIGAVPIAFSLGVLRGGFARTGEVEELGTWLGASVRVRPALSAALASVLGDDTLTVVFWLVDHGHYVRSSGERVDLPDEGSGRAWVEIELDSRLVGAILYDALLIEDAELVRTAGRIVAIAVDRERLTAALLASEQSLRESRQRIAEAADLERRRIAQDLHDGLQVKLVLLAVAAQQLAKEITASPDVRMRATSLREGIDGAAAELRTLVHAVMPASLIENGLGSAAEDLIDRMPMQARLHLGVVDGSLPKVVESTAYFIIAESLSNAVKHSDAHSVDVRLDRLNDQLIVEVSDDGIGGASLGLGTGLRGLADRVDVLGGRLLVSSAKGRGTTVTAELPCAS